MQSQSGLTELPFQQNIKALGRFCYLHGSFADNSQLSTRTHKDSLQSNSRPQEFPAQQDGANDFGGKLFPARFDATQLHFLI